MKNEESFSFFRRFMSRESTPESTEIVYRSCIFGNFCFFNKCSCSRIFSNLPSQIFLHKYSNIKM